MRSPLRVRAVLVLFALVLVAACLAAFAAWRVLQSRVAPSAATWNPPLPVSPSPDGTDPTVVVPTVSADEAATPANDLTPIPTLSEGPAPSPEPLPTGAAPGPTPSPLVSDGYRILQHGSVRHTADGCPGQYILGLVLDSQGDPLSGVRLRAIDQWGNESTAFTKAGTTDAGQYDFPLFPAVGAAMTYGVVVEDAEGNAISPVVEVLHHHEGPGHGANCHWLDWQAVE